MSTTGNFDARLRKLKIEYCAALPDKIAAISSEWDRMLVEWDATALNKLIRELHNLLGSSGTFGLASVSKIAREIEVQLKQLSSTENVEINNYTLLAGEISSSMKSLVEAASTLSEAINFDAGSSEHNPSPYRESAKDCLIYYLDDELAGPQFLTKQLMAYGFKCKHFRTMMDLLNAMQYFLPDLVILDLMMPDITPPEIFEVAKAILKKETKVFILSGSSDFDSRLSAVRAGVHAYIEKPADVALIVSKIRAALQLQGNRPPKILIIDDQEAIAEYYAMVLRQSAMVVQIETTPSNVLQIMNDMPDLVLLDLNMPYVSGIELATIIRQQDQFQSIPIVFLSAEDIQAKSNLLELGSDDLLKKGIPPEEFVRHIRSRVNRAKALASKMHQDSLTGLLNHAQIQSLLEKEYLRSKRQNMPLSVVMIDIDNFKSINDTYGHLIGDKVILALSHLLEQRLRSTDYLGRFGGEEFLLVMPDSSVDNAGTIINNLRIIFSKLKFDASGEEFSVTFSAGLSGRDGASTAIEQLRRADVALYQAKNRGRNLVCANYEGGST